ncbi:alkylhydroperoxidase [Aeromicrobium sp. Root344]|uniref:carboxymuconolactone decarboxylase family protein n=1 Tax=Aeromicrobium sp. Root344 TaxID=1736521 RepID=UPI0006FEAF7E|nr:carboxymuconolactone decarboxylase family protein [Aeromicrobium sp. Root344]KQV76541.1 alkylhydroperoxidase [Aeromicrobium sp. Root344]
MQARMDNPAITVPGAMEALHGLTKAVLKTGISPTTLELVNLRASQINGCSVCLQMHASDLRKAGESDEKIDTVAGWRDSPHFDDAERAALGLAEEVTRLSDRSDAVPDEVYDEAAAHYDEQQLGALILSIAAINVWNRVNVSTRQVAGAWG